MKEHRIPNLRPCSAMEFHKTKALNLKTHLFPAYIIEGYSLITEYIYNWILKGFAKGFFKSINLDGHDPHLELKQWKLSEWLHRQKPSLSIVSEEDYMFDNDNVDSDFDTITTYINRTGYKMGFFHDNQNNLHIGMLSKVYRVEYTIKMRLNTKAEQLQLFEYLKLTKNIGRTHNDMISLDVPIPDELIRRVAADGHFKFDDKTGAIKEPTKFLSYLNDHSTQPIFYKVRGINSRYEYYLRLSDVIMHLREITAEPNRGERKGMIYENFDIEMHLEARCPYPKFFIYFSELETTQVVYRDKYGEPRKTTLNLNNIPKMNSSGWNILLEGDFIADDDKAPIKVSILEMFQTTNGSNNDIIDTIDYCRAKMMSPEKFLDIVVYNGYQKIDTYIDWSKMILYSRNVLPYKASHIVVYADLGFMNSVVSDRYGYKQQSNRIKSYSDTTKKYEGTKQ